MGLTAGGCCPTSPQSLSLGKTPWLAWSSILVSGNPCWQMQGMFQPRAFDGTVSFVVCFHWHRYWSSCTPCPSPGAWLVTGHAEVLTASTSVAMCSFQPCVSRGSAPAPAFLIISPCCWAWPYWVLQHLQQLRRKSYQQCSLMVLLAQAGLASMAIKQLWDFLGAMRTSPWLIVEFRN